jgi:hypothetical protein
VALTFWHHKRSKLEARIKKEINMQRHAEAIKAGAAPQKLGQFIDFYKERYPEVYLVWCQSCGSLLAIEVSDPQNPNPDHWQQRTVIPVNDDLLAAVKRQDGVMGYQCGHRMPNPTYQQLTKDPDVPSEVTGQIPETVFCFNDSRTFDIEEEVLPPDPVTGGQPAKMPHHTFMIEQLIKERGYQPNVEIEGDKMRVDGFTIEKVK